MDAVAAHTTISNGGSVTESINSITKRHVSNKINGMDTTEESPAKRVKVDESSANTAPRRSKGTVPVKAEYISHSLRKYVPSPSYGY
jgi:hypothetical protein